MTHYAVTYIHGLPWLLPAPDGGGAPASPVEHEPSPSGPGGAS